jgi:hypothetical protein
MIRLRATRLPAPPLAVVIDAPKPPDRSERLR